jgi:CheY-like chemotaxis protein
MPHKLLLADDSVTIQRVIELTFADEDVKVTAVGDGKKAIASIQADRPDIVLADVGMPERDGYEVAAFIKGNAELAHIPVLLLTGAFEPIDETRARAVGCDGVLVKPFEPQMVINRVKDLLAGRAAPSVWGSGPPGQIPTRQPVPGGDFDAAPATPNAAPPGPGGSLEDYFDRLDAAFATLDGGPGNVAAAPPRPPADTPREHAAFNSPAHQVTTPSTGSLPDDDLRGWDPTLSGDPKKPAAVEPVPAHSASVPSVHAAAAAPAPPAAVSAPAAPAAVAAAPTVLPSLADAFAALLSAEQRQPVRSSSIGAAEVPDGVVEEIVRRVIARMGEQAVRDTVLEVAERLVRQEIDHIKNA